MSDQIDTLGEALAALRACLRDNGGQLIGESSGPAGVFEQWQFSDYNTVIIELTPPGYRTLPISELAKIPMQRRSAKKGKRP